MRGSHAAARAWRPTLLSQLVNKAGQHGLKIAISGVLFMVRGNLSLDLVSRLAIFKRHSGPPSPRMHRVPRRSLICPGRRRIAMLSKAVEDTGLVVPKRPKQMDQVVLCRRLPAALHNQGAVVEIREIKRGRGLGYVFAVLRKN